MKALIYLWPAKKALEERPKPEMCRPRVGQPGLRLDDRRVRSGEEQSLRITGRGFHCSGDALRRYVCDGHALPEFRLDKALLENFRFETAIADAKELLTEKRCYSVAAQSISSTTAWSTSRLRSTPRCRRPMLAATLS
jgi:hypothetical protein